MSENEAKLPGLKSDKALLTILSTANASSLRTPWRTLAYDSCMTTLIATPKSETKLRAPDKQYLENNSLFDHTSSYEHSSVILKFGLQYSCTTASFNQKKTWIPCMRWLDRTE